VGGKGAREVEVLEKNEKINYVQITSRFKLDSVDVSLTDVTTVVCFVL